MAEPARSYATQPDEIAEPKPILQLVHGTVAEVGLVTEPNVGRSAVIGYMVGFFVAALAITGAGALAGWGFGNALGLGVFVGIWGGGGFGFMMGATVPYARYLDALSTHSTHHGQGDTSDTATR
jgi:hypothetical protein